MNNKKIQRNELLLWFGNWTSKIGNIIFDYANSITIVTIFSEKPWMLALYQSSETLIQIIFNLIGGVKADRGNRKKIVIVTDIISALICVVLSFFVGTGYMGVIMILANAMLAIVYAFNSPTYKSIIREVIEKECIGFFNSVAHAGSELIRVTGPIVGIGLVKFIGVRGALIFDAITFIVSACAELFLKRINDIQIKSGNNTNIIEDIKEGFRFLFKERKILFLVVLSSMVNFFLAGYNLLMPYTNLIYADLVEGFYARALTFEAIGGIISSVCYAKIIDRYKQDVNMLILLLMGTGFSLILEPLCAISENYYICLIPFMLFGVFLTVFNIQFMSYIQVAVDENYLGRVFSIIFTIAVLFMPIGSMFFSSVGDAGSIRSYYSVGGGIVLLALISLVINKGFCL